MATIRVGIVMEREIYCESALTSSGWLDRAVIKLDQQGMISAISDFPSDAGFDQAISDARASKRGHVIPGMPNLHSHAFQRQMAGLTGSGGGHEDNFWSWREAMYRLAERVTPESLKDLAAGLQMEMLEAGYTSCAEFHYVHHQPGGQAYDNPAEMSSALIEAADSSGMALTLLPVLYCRSGFGATTVTDRQRRFYNSPEQFLELLQACMRMLENQALHRVGLAPHSLRAVSRQQLMRVLDAPEVAGMPVHIHIAEQPAEVEDCLATHGVRPVDYLLDQFTVDERWCLVHATHLAASELQRAALSGATAGLCPTTEADLADGFFDAEAWLKAGGSFGIGSDSNLRVSVAEELRLLEFGCRLRTHRRNVLASQNASCGRSLFEGAATGGASALRQPVGQIKVGRRADLLELDGRHPLLQGRRHDTVLDSWLFAGGKTMLQSVWVAGQLRVAEGRHINREVIEHAYARAIVGLT